MTDTVGEPWTETSAGVNEHKEVVVVVVKPEKKFKCPECGKTFLSEKAIHGHMRWHPDRSHRGMKAPKKPSLSITSEEESMWGAICSLMLIATRDERYRITPTSKKNTTRVSQNLSVSSKKARVEIKTETETEKEMVIYKCSLCRRCFWSPQALGGHTSSAHKSKSKSKSKKVEVEKGRRRGASVDTPHHHDEYKGASAAAGAGVFELNH